MQKSILKVTADDADSGINGEVYYSFLLDYESFSINPSSGVISLIKPLNFGEQTRFDLIALANDRASIIKHQNQHASKAKITILIKQVNLHSPQISFSSFTSVTQNSSYDTYAIINVSDKDLGRHGEIKNLDIIDGDHGNYFYIKKTESSGKYYIKRKKYAVFNETDKLCLTIYAEDDGIPVRSTQVFIPIEIANENLFPPIFTKEFYEVSIAETTPINTPVIRLKANELLTKNGALIYLEIVGGNKGGEFKINPISGMVYTQKLLDAEKKAFYTLTVSARDQTYLGTRKQSSAKLKVNVEDMNDNDPIFDNVNSTIEIDENKVAGTFVIKLTARDKDSGENSYITYSIANINYVPFDIDHFTGTIKTTSVIDYETMPRKYILSIRASDWGLPFRRQSEIKITVLIKNINDNRPQFERIQCMGKLLRNVPPGTDIFTMSAIDFDAGDYITYRLDAGNDGACFNIDSTTGILTVTCDLMTKNITEKTIEISATDGTHFSDKAYINIEIKESLDDKIFHKALYMRYHTFECRETGVAKRLTEVLAKAEKNNAKLGNFSDNIARIPSRYGENVHSPEFVDFPLAVSVNESSQLGETFLWIKARDRDLGYNGKLAYAISDGDESSVFRIDPENGELQIIGFLDRERQEDYILNITVFDLGNPQKSTSKLLPIDIVDCNDNTPIFEKQFSQIHLAENTINETDIFCFKASDADSGRNAQVFYYMQTKLTEFCINSTNGCIKLCDVLDRENNEKYELHIIARDNGIPSLSTIGVLNIIIDDMNDNAPKFGAQEFSFQVREDIPKGTMIAVIEATDIDVGLNSEIHFSLKEEFENEDYFKIDKYTGVIRTQEMLDYETCQIHNLIIYAIDCGTPSLTTSLAVIIEVVDVNENIFAPEFDNFVYIGNITENSPESSFIMKITATDLDETGPDSKIMYSIRGGNGLGYFSVNNEGEISSLSHLDAESTNSYWLTLCAQDQAVVPLSSCVQVYIAVENENDNVPLTEKPIYFTSVLEGSPQGTKIIQLTAFDTDIRPSIIMYKIISGNPEGFFVINSKTGLITTTERKLDRENISEHNLEVAIFDDDIPSLTSITTIVIKVEDVNDNSPEFDERLYKIQVPFDIGVNQDIFQIRATDDDIERNGKIVYYLKSGKGKNKFRVDKDTGVIYVLKKLDLNAEYELNVRAEDNGNPKRSQSATINIIVVSVNESSSYPPVIKSKDTTVDVTEGDRPGFLITLIQAVDADGDHLWYNISNGNDRNEFYIDRERGNIVLSKFLRWETQKLYNLTISVSDGHSLVTTQLYVHVVDTNNNRPKFENDVYYVNITENVQIESIILRLKSNDSNDDQKLFYMLHTVQDTSSLLLFKVDSLTGSIIVNQKLDYEKMFEHVLIVAVKDQGTPAKKNFAKVFIYVSDHNDNAPEFDTKIIQGRIPENAAIFSKVLQINAIDRDFGKNSEIRYSIIGGNVQHTFDIDHFLGIITLVKSVNIKTMQEYILHVKATDLGIPPLSATISIHFIVTMSENYPPTFSFLYEAIDIYENLPVNSYIKKIESRSSTSVFYEITKGNHFEFFRINPSTGLVMINGNIDHEKYRSFNLTISATNMASASAEMNLSVNVLDVNDNSPRFTLNNYVGKISEGASIGSFINMNSSKDNKPLLIKAIDKDSGLNGLIKYIIEDEFAAQVFEIESATGAVKLIQQIDYESTTSFSFKVMVHDMGVPKLFSDDFATVKIIVLNINDSPPKFDKNEYNFSLPLPTFPNIILGEVHAEDADRDNNPIRYDIVDGNANDCFELYSTAGVLTIRNATFLNKINSLYVRASDGLHSTIVPVHINIEKVDNLDFSFQKPLYEFSIVENSTKIVTIGLVNVVGTVLHENVEYIILTPQSKFSIGKTSGAIKTMGISFDREECEKYKLIIEAKSMQHDIKNPMRRAYATVIVYVLDVNDNCPIFVNTPYSAIISDNDLQGRVLTKVKAIDLDSSENGEIRYEMKKGNGDLFKIDRKTGDVILKQIASEYKNKYEIAITAYDSGVTPCATEVLLNIMVVNKSTPIFNKQFYTFNIKEDIELFSTLPISINAEIPSQRNLIYTIFTKDDAHHFEIDFSTGIISVVDKLDYESIQSYELSVRATDSFSGIYAEVSVFIQINDVNDCYPLFKEDNYNITIPENQLVGTKILEINASDCDSNANSYLSYFIDDNTMQNNTKQFYMNKVDGSLFLNAALDCETREFYHLKVIAIDHGIPQLKSETNVWISVTDVNDNAPSFLEPSFTAKLSPFVKKGHFLTIAKAFDLDESDNEKLRYNIIEGNEIQLFMIDEHSGVITVRSIWKSGLSQQIFLNISVTDGVFTSYARLKIVTLPANLHTPVFVQHTYKTNIKENQLPGLHVVSIHANDLDTGIYGSIAYDIISEKINKIFELNSINGSLVTKTVLDREDIKRYEFVVKATDGGGRFSFATIIINIEDENDNIPIFTEKEYNFLMTFDAPINVPLFKVEAIDLDEKLNGEISYVIDEETLEMPYLNYIHLHKTDGYLTITHTPKNFFYKTIKFFIRAIDSGDPKMHSVVPVTLEFLNFSIPVPVFEEKLVHLNILESTTPGTVLTRLRVTGNYSIEYFLSKDTTQFFINSNGDFLLTEPLDHEKVEKYHVVAKFNTKTTPTLFGHTSILITVLDDNDNFPKFDCKVYSVEVPENIEKMTSLTKITATDLDSGTNSEIQFELERSNFSNLFKIDSLSGWIISTTNFDREEQSEYFLNVFATDNGFPKHTSQVQVIVKILDYNDNAPQFTQMSYNIFVMEDAQPGTILYNFLLTDLDSVKEEIDFFIISGDNNSHFQIGSSGELFVSKSLDREKNSFFNITLLATDGKFCTYTHLLINVQDVNDNNPICLIPRYYISVNESAPIGSPLTKIIVTDFDDTFNKELKYYLSGNQSEDFFIEKSTGMLRVAKFIDREYCHEYRINVHVQDGSNFERQCSSEIFISVLDLNDNKPEFILNSYIISLYEDAAVQTILTKVHATDKDSGLNRKISYSLTKENAYFHLCESSGILKLMKNLDREAISSFNMSVKAEDHGNPKLFSFTRLIVNVLDVNDNPPEFTSSHYIANLYENASINTAVIRILATSKDIGVNAQMNYFLIRGNEQKKFGINAMGDIFVNGELDFEKSKQYYMFVQAVDGGVPPLSNVASVNIIICDVNDNKPKFSQNPYAVKILEDIKIGVKVLQIIASDEDSGENALINYYIEKGNKFNRFSIDQQTGQITVGSNLDRESIPNHILEIKACDNGYPKLCSYVNANIEILDVNDNPPIFSKANYSVFVPENRELGNVILKFNITDNDEIPNTSPFTFDIRRGNQDGSFRLEQDGSLRTAVHFNHVVCDTYELQVRVFDNGTPPLYSDTLVNIKIIEESQYPPIIKPLEITVKSFDDNFLGGFLGKVHALDQDIYDKLSFVLSTSPTENPEIKELFEIIPNTGSLYAMSNLDIGFYKLNVTVSDGKYNSSALVQLNVELVTTEMIKHAALIKFTNVTPEEFILSHRKAFIRSISTLLECQPNDIVLIAVQSFMIGPYKNDSYIQRREMYEKIQAKSDKNLDVVFAVKKSHSIEKFIMKELIQSSILKHKKSIELSTNLLIENIGFSECQNISCINGKCNNRLTVHKDKLLTYFTDVVSFVAQQISKKSECQCKQGFGGMTCQEKINACSSNPCLPQRQCLPSNSVHGYECVCPRGSTGPHCENELVKCFSSDCSKIFGSISFNGSSYTHYEMSGFLAKSLRNSFKCSLKIRTIQQIGIIYYASGKVDYSVLEIVNGSVQFKFDLGSGECVVSSSSVSVSDGEWHKISVERHYKTAKLIVDTKHVSQCNAPGPNEMLDINPPEFFFGAELKLYPSITGITNIQKGFIGCMADIKIDDEFLPLYISNSSLTAALKRFKSIEFKCEPLNIFVHHGICGNQPCFNGGICLNLGKNDFECKCQTRFVGRLCEFDLDPCASSPCLFGGKCVNEGSSNFSCICPLNLTGRRCEYGKFCNPNPCKNGGDCEEGEESSHCICHGYTGPTCEFDLNECVNQPCGNGATCINEAGSFRCVCPSSLTGASCGDPLYSNSISTKIRNFSIEHVTGIIFGTVLIFTCIVIYNCVIIIKKRGLWKELFKSNDYQKETNLNSLLSKEKNSKNSKITNLEVVHHRRNFTQPSNDCYLQNPPLCLNNLDISRSYGSAGDELENIPYEYQKENQIHQQINITAFNFDSDSCRKKDWCEQMHLKTFGDNKINNEIFKKTLVPVRCLSGGCNSLESGDNICLSYGQYHWDCSDWVRKSHNVLPNITEVPVAEVIETSSIHSSDSQNHRAMILFFEAENMERTSLLSNINIEGIKGSNSDVSENVCEIEDSEVEDS